MILFKSSNFHIWILYLSLADTVSHSRCIEDITAEKTFKSFSKSGLAIHFWRIHKYKPANPFSHWKPKSNNNNIETLLPPLEWLFSCGPLGRFAIHGLGRVSFHICAIPFLLALCLQFSIAFWMRGLVCESVCRLERGYSLCIPRHASLV